MSIALRQTRLTILLSLNAVAIVIAGIMIASAIGLNDGIEFQVVSEYSDVSKEEAKRIDLLDSADAAASERTPNGTTSYKSLASGVLAGIGTDPIPNGQLWNETKITMYQTADFDICVGGGLTDIGDMYWQTSNQEVISGFYATARDWLGYNSKTCKYPMIVGTGTTTITAGTYDGLRHDELEVTVIAPPVNEWRREVLNLVNAERVNNGLSVLSWGETCESAANLRAQESVVSYSHTRPSGSAWSTACPIPTTGGVSGENLAAGNAAVSPASVVAAWMNSPEHRANILNPEFTKLAVGFVFNPDSQYKTYWSQFFTNY